MHVSLEALLALRLGPFPPERKRRERSSSTGDRVSRLRGRGVDFAEVRAYQAGDDVRSIDWRVTARKNKPHTKVFREERERPTLLYIDQTHTLFFGSQVRLKSVAAAELGARLAWRCLNSGDRVGGLVSGVTGASVVRPLRSPKAVARLLGELARHNQALHRDANQNAVHRLADDLRQLRQLATHQHRIFLITDLLPVAAPWLEAIASLARNNDLVVCHVIDPLELELPSVERFVVTDSRSRLTVDPGNRRQALGYRDSFQRRERELRERLRALGVPYQQLFTDQPIDLTRMVL
ncbi:MAG: DUF58 domain-containing protein [Pseudomonadota bacterium]